MSERPIIIDIVIVNIRNVPSEKTCFYIVFSGGDIYAFILEGVDKRRWIMWKHAKKAKRCMPLQRKFFHTAGVLQVME